MNRESNFGNSIYCLRQVLLALILLGIGGEVEAKKKKELFFTCEVGFKFESNQSAARCIKRPKQVFRKPLPCKPIIIDGKKVKRKLVVDSNSTFDLCIQSNKTAAKPKSFKANKRNILPECPGGFGIFHRPGKDACLQLKKEVIKAPTRQIVR